MTESEWLYSLLHDNPTVLASIRRVVLHVRENWPTTQHGEWVVGNHCMDMLRVLVVADTSPGLARSLAMSGIAGMDRDAVGRYWLEFFDSE